ncbi:hypothetical protein RFI_20769 [Reticulomyxa filosa]|uniref:Uncharacterized protein n=1 Tax=Reticulomyxa filosa TaxID=46433 RepID=X6MRW8_RETFI|nr:hypothetical protein RFI_20769 [Reticulomyxa filosa]|eukprot:ETO16574.1 hypothetical protein RFI_20769 [Reticulomyxa filosa]
MTQSLTETTSLTLGFPFEVSYRSDHFLTPPKTRTTKTKNKTVRRTRQKGEKEKEDIKPIILNDRIVLSDKKIMTSERCHYMFMKCLEEILFYRSQIPTRIEEMTEILKNAKEQKNFAQKAKKIEKVKRKKKKIIYFIYFSNQSKKYLI